MEADSIEESVKRAECASRFLRANRDPDASWREMGCTWHEVSFREVSPIGNALMTLSCPRVLSAFTFRTYGLTDDR